MEKNGTDVISTLSMSNWGERTMVKRVPAMSGNLTEQLDWDLIKCMWFSIQCDKSMDSSRTSQLMMITPMMFSKPAVLTLQPLKTTTRGVDIYNVVKRYFVEKKVPLEKLV